MLDKNLIQKEFGYMGDHVYLNSSLVGMPPERVKDACRRFMDDYVASYNESIKADLLAKRQMTKQNVAQMIHAKPEEITFEKNVTESLSTFAMGYAPLGPGTNAIIVDSDFPNTIYPWINAHKQRGFDLKVYKTTRGQIPAGDLIAMMDENTRVLALSMVQSGWGYYADLKALGQECRKRGIAFVVDGFQGLGRLGIDVQECCIDYLPCGGFKALMGTWGAAFVYCNPRIIQDIYPPTAGYQSAVSHVLAPDVTTDFSEVHFLDTAQRLEAGSQCTYAIESIGIGVGLILELGMEEIEKHVLELDRYTRQGLKDMPVDVITPDDPARLSGLIAILYPKSMTAKVRETFAKYNIHATLRDGYIRITIALFNTKENMDVFLEAMREIFCKGENK
ncbi:aminotransferase class V-fold PLP-dependent enzyme [Hominifimenecus sp. rT4P-3]|uniref:aminotransferase class V-fold PLP-dependent enzyme n=1 Tax=Hominifimenecus sp. rT4P-3 TaxID=3242979 RepID=UPI003DA591A1